MVGGHGRNTHITNGIPALDKFLGFIGLDPGKVRLVSGIAACHQLCIHAVFVGKCLFPCIFHGAIAPSKHLLALRDAAVRDMHYAAVFAFVIAAEEIIMGSSCKIRGCRSGIFMIADISGIAHPDTCIIFALGNGEIGVVSSVMVLYIMYIRREKQSVLLINRNSGILPPHKRTAHSSAVIKAHLRIKHSCIGGQTDTYHASGTVKGIIFSQPYCNSAVFFFLNRVIGGHKSGRSVMAGPVKFQTAGDPFTHVTDQRGFDDMLFV